MSEDRHDLQLQTDMKRLLLRWEKQSHLVLFSLQGVNTPEERHGRRSRPLTAAIAHKYTSSLGTQTCWKLLYVIYRAPTRGRSGSAWRSRRPTRVDAGKKRFLASIR